MGQRKVIMVNRYSSIIGGIERYMIDMCTIFKRNGWSVAAIFTEQRDSNDVNLKLFDEVYCLDNLADIEVKLNKLKDKGYNTVFLHKLNDNNALRSVISLFDNTIAVIHDHDYYCMRSHKYFPYKRINCKYPFSLIRCSLCTGMVVKVAGKFPPVKFKNPFLYSTTLSLLKKCRKIIVLSDYMKDNMLKNNFSPDQIEKVYPVVKILDKPDSMTKKTSSINLLYAGQLIRGKGVDLLINAVSNLKIDFNLRIVGRGNDESYINSLIDSFKLRSNVEMRGFSENIDAEYSWADIVVVPSRWQEPFGLVGVEAFARKCPVIGFDVGGISEWLHDGVNGVLVPELNLEKMAQAILYLSENCELRKKMGEKGFEFVKDKCSEKAFIDRFTKITDHLLGGGNV